MQAREGDEPGSTGGVVAGAVIDLVTLPLLGAQVVPVRAVDNVLVRVRGARQSGNDIPAAQRVYFFRSPYTFVVAAIVPPFKPEERTGKRNRPLLHPPF